MLQYFSIRVGFPSSVTSRSSSPFAARKIGPPALLCCPSSLLSAPMPRGCLYWQSMHATCAPGIRPPDSNSVPQRTNLFELSTPNAKTTNSAMLVPPTDAGLLVLSCPPAQLAAGFMLHKRMRCRQSPWEDSTSGTMPIRQK